MGNCIKGEAAVSWADEEEERGWADAHHRRRRHYCASPAKSKAKSDEGQELLKEEEVEAEAPATEVKIKITKKQLEDLLRKVETQGVPLHQVLAHLMPGAYDDVLQDRTRHWRPALQSIPEAAE